MVTRLRWREDSPQGFNVRNYNSSLEEFGESSECLQGLKPKFF
jgi:hypothetical protein